MNSKLVSAVRDCEMLHYMPNPWAPASITLLAVITDIPRPTLYSYLTRGVEPSTENWRRLADALGMTLSEIQQ